MTRALEIAKRNEVFSLIKKVGDRYGEDIDFLREYAKEIIQNNDLDRLLLCFRDLVEKTKYLKPS
jgi:hypothetical protein